MAVLSGWGRYPVVRGLERLSENLEVATEEATLSRGLGRSYGDASLPAREQAVVVGTRLADRILGFDPKSGLLRVEAGLSLRRLNALFLPRGWSSPVVPGTQIVTLGGMAAADVHGKNQHDAGSFGDHVRSLRMRVADGRVLEVNESCEPELFHATLGGMGLTGHILEVELRLQRIPSAWIWQEIERLPALDPLVERLREASRSWPFTVAWVDGTRRGRALGRGILFKGRWAEAHEAPSRPPRDPRGITVPRAMPGWLLNPLSIRAFNALYFRRVRETGKRGPVEPQRFFFPLDAILEWNRLYGRRGFTQYQCVVPEGDTGAPRRLFEILIREGGSPFLTVLKDFGRHGRGSLSFAMPGITIAFDLALRGSSTQRLVDALNEEVVASGGRVYLAKDALTRPEHFRAMEPRLEAWSAVRRRFDPGGRIATAQSVRLLGDAG